MMSRPRFLSLVLCCLTPFLAFTVRADERASLLVFAETAASAGGEALDPDFLAAQVTAALAGSGFDAREIADLSTAEDLPAILATARRTGADYALLVRLDPATEEVTEYSGNDVQTRRRILSAPYSFRLVTAATGATVLGDTGTARQVTRATENLRESYPDARQALVPAAARSIARAIRETITPGELTPPPAEATEVSFQVTPLGRELVVPEIRETENGRLRATGERQPMILEGVTVILDEVALGSAPGAFTAPAGLHTLTLEREGFRPWSRTIQVTPDLELRIPLVRTEESRSVLREDAAFLERLRSERVLTEAEAERVRGLAQAYRQSGYRWDIRSDSEVRSDTQIRVDTDEAIRIEQDNRSLLGD